VHKTRVSAWSRFLSGTSLACIVLLTNFGCGRQSKPPPAGAVEENDGTSPVSTEAPTPAKTTAKATTPPPPQKRVPVSTQPPPPELWREFSGRRALDTAGKLVNLGPRPAGSAELDAARRLLIPALEKEAWEVESTPFESVSPSGPVRGVNLIARFSAEGLRPVPRTARAILVVAAYDTRKFSTIRFVGANDGASGPAALVELARVLALNPRLAEKVELLFPDASEPLQQFTPDDGVAGSRHFLASIDPSSLRRVLVLGGIGANGETLTFSPDTSTEILQEVTQACTRIGRPSLVRKLDRYVWGDHVPFADSGVPSLYLGNHDYLSRYTADDRIEKLSADALEQAGRLSTYLIEHWIEP